MPFVPSSQEGRPWRQRWRRRLLRSQQLRRRLFKRPARDVQRNVLELRPRGPGPLPPEWREAGLLQRLLHQSAKFEQPLLLNRDRNREGARVFGLLFDSWGSDDGTRTALIHAPRHPFDIRQERPPGTGGTGCAREKRADRAAPSCATGDPVARRGEFLADWAAAAPDPNCSGGPVPGAWPRCP